MRVTSNLLITLKNFWISLISMATLTSKSAADAPTSNFLTEDDDASLESLVGKDGEVLDTLQELTRLAVLTATGERSRLILDIGGYRADRAEELRKIAEDAVATVRETGEKVHLVQLVPTSVSSSTT